MNTSIANGVVSILNGFAAMIGALASPVTIAVIVSAACLWWLAVCETEELNRQATKPEVGRH